MTLLLSVQRRECSFPPLRDKRSYRRSRAILLALPLKECTYTPIPLYRPHLENFRLLWDTLGVAFGGRPKLILDPRAGGRRHVWLADPEKQGLSRAIAPAPPVTEPED